MIFPQFLELFCSGNGAKTRLRCSVLFGAKTYCFDPSISILYSPTGTVNVFLPVVNHSSIAYNSTGIKIGPAKIIDIGEKAQGEQLNRDTPSAQLERPKLSVFFFLFADEGADRQKVGAGDCDGSGREEGAQGDVGADVDEREDDDDACIQHNTTHGNLKTRMYLF